MNGIPRKPKNLKPNSGNSEEQSAKYKKELSKLEEKHPKAKSLEELKQIFLTLSKEEIEECVEFINIEMAKKFQEEE